MRFATNYIAVLEPTGFTFGMLVIQWPFLVESQSLAGKQLE